MYKKQVKEKISGKGVTIRKAAQTVGRNNFCPCGSKKKFKKCCLVRINEDQRRMVTYKSGFAESTQKEDCIPPESSPSESSH
jgi:hypothetical protein